MSFSEGSLMDVLFVHFAMFSACYQYRLKKNKTQQQVKSFNEIQSNDFNKLNFGLKLLYSKHLFSKK